MSKPENTGVRPSEYSAWHRTLGNGCYAVDIDWAEYRIGRGVVALIAATGRLKDERHIINSKKFIWKRTEIERAVMTEISGLSRIPAFFVIHTEDLSVFHVHELPDITKFKSMNNEEYSDFIKEL